MSSFNCLPKHDVKITVLLPFQSTAETLSIMLLKLVSYMHTHNITAIFLPIFFNENWKYVVPNCDWCSLHPFLCISSLLFIILSVSVIKWSNLVFHLSTHLPIHPPALSLQRDMILPLSNTTTCKSCWCAICY